MGPLSPLLHAHCYVNTIPLWCNPPAVVLSSDLIVVITMDVQNHGQNRNKDSHATKSSALICLGPSHLYSRQLRCLKNSSVKLTHTPMNMNEHFAIFFLVVVIYSVDFPNVDPLLINRIHYAYMRLHLLRLAIHCFTISQEVLNILYDKKVMVPSLCDVFVIHSNLL